MLPDIPPTARSAARKAALAVLALVSLAGVLWLGLAAERHSVQLAALTDRLDALALAAEIAPKSASQDEALAALTAEVAGLGKKLDALAGDDAKAVARLAGEVKNLAGRIDALAAARSAPEKTTAKPAAKAKDQAPPPPARTPRSGAPDTTQPPYYGPGYPAWPAY